MCNSCVCGIEPTIMLVDTQNPKPVYHREGDGGTLRVWVFEWSEQLCVLTIRDGHARLGLCFTFAELCWFGLLTAEERREPLIVEREIAPTMNDSFSLQVTPELMLKLTKENYPELSAKPKRRTPQRPAGRRQMGMEMVEKDADGRHEPLNPVFPGFLSALPGLGHANDARKELVPIYKVLEESERVGEMLQKQEEGELSKVKQLAEELQEKQYRAPSQPVPCTSEKDACIQCYHENAENPLQCADIVKAFKECSQRIHQDYIAQQTAASL